MSEYDPEAASPPERVSSPQRRQARRSMPGCIAVLVALVVVLGGGYFVVTKGVDAIKGQFSSAEDFGGPGRGRVTFQVHEGDSVTAIGQGLKAAGIVASVEAFTDAAASDSRATGIQVGFYQLRKEMPAADALAVLVDPDNILTDSVTIPEGYRVSQIVATLADKTDFKEKDFTRVLDDPAELGLPGYAHGNAEGYLFPSTYGFGPDATPTTMLKAMVDRWRQAADDADLEAGAEALGYTPAELMTIASLVQSEGRGSDMPKIARVIYNRLEGSETGGRLQIDSTVNYAAGNSLGAVPTTDDLDIDSPYNTYLYAGLPPTPIEAPGDDAIAAALHPADGGWFYYVTVNLRTGKTKFAETYDEFLQFKAELDDYCATQSAGAC